MNTFKYCLWLSICLVSSLPGSTGLFRVVTVAQSLAATSCDCLDNSYVFMAISNVAYRY